MTARESGDVDGTRTFVDRVAVHFDDLSASRRRELVRDLVVHLQELPAEARADLGDPDDYARELREALALPDGRAVRTPRTGTRGRMLMIAAIVALLVAAGLVTVVVRDHQRNARTTPATADRVSVPVLVGTVQDEAARMITESRLRYRIHSRESSSGWGTVLHTTPAAGSIVATSSTVVLDVAVPMGGALNPALVPTVRPVLVATRPGGESMWVDVSAVTPGHGGGRTVMVGNPPHPFIVPGTGLCAQVWIVNSGGSGQCVDPRFAPRVVLFGGNHWIAGCAVATAATVTIHYAHGPDQSVATFADAAVPGVHFFLAATNRLPSLAGATGLDSAGRVVARSAGP